MDDELGLQYRIEKKNAINKFQQIKRGIQLNDNDNYDLTELIKNSTTKWSTPEWGFPKGRRNYGEKDLQSAIREWGEETGYPSNILKIITNVVPYNEYFVGSNYKSYKHKYYLGFINNNCSNDNYQKSEVSQLKWLSYEKC